MIKVVLWDFDGVILDSMKIRDWGFTEIFKKFDRKLIDKLLIFHRKNAGLSRYVKIRYFFEELLNQPIDEELVMVYAKKFSILMRKELVNPSHLIIDSLTFIVNNHKKYNFHIVSGSDQEELRFLCKKLNIEKYFKTICGSPTEKSVLVRNIINHFKKSLKSYCLIGDSINDYKAAIENNIKFYNYNNKNLINFGVNIKNFLDFKPFS